MVDVCKNCLLAVPRQNKINEAVNGEGALILQVMLQNLSGAIDHELQKILEAAVLRYLQEEIHCKFFRARLLNVIYSAFIYNA